MSDTNQTDKESVPAASPHEQAASNEATMGPVNQPQSLSMLPRTVDHEESPQSGRMVGGKYKLLNAVGEGGMGTVWMAEQREPVKRLVAIKLIKAGMDSKLVLARFEAERQALAMMDHPNIARILDGGITESGSPYFVMELVKGVPITEYCDARKLTPQQRLELFVPVCHAIQHAHQKGIIHRDIKPSNVMISLYDDKPVPKVIDFGVAKATGQSLTEHTLNTGFSVVGTPQYMSPEQATFNQIDIDTRSDIYSLGILLYELLAGSPPFQKKELEKAGYLEILRVIREDEPPRPSTKLSTADGLPSLSATRSTEPKKLTGILRNELDWIVMKALEKDRSRRYETANAFAADIGRYLSGEAVQAHPPSQAYRLQKFFRKNKGPVLAASLVFLALLAGFVGTTFGLFEANKQREIAVGKQREAEQEREKANASAIAESEQRIKAEKAEDEALEAYRTSTDEAIEQLMDSKEFFGPMEKKYLQSTLERWKKFSERQDDTTRGQAIRAEGHYQVGTLWSFFHEHKLAIKELESAIVIQEKLVQESPNSPKYSKQLADSYYQIANSHSEKGNHEESIRWFAQALISCVKASSLAPENLEITKRSMLIRKARAFELTYLGRDEEVLVEYDETLKLCERLLSNEPDNPVFQRALVHALQMPHIQRNRKKEWVKWIEESEKAKSVAKKLVGADPENPLFLTDLANSSYDLAVAFSEMGKLADAIRHIDDAINIFDSLSTKFPSRTDCVKMSAMCRDTRAATLADLRRFGEAIADSSKAIAIQEVLVNRYPENRFFSFELARSRWKLAEILFKTGEKEKALEMSRLNESQLELYQTKYPDLRDTFELLSSVYARSGKIHDSLQQSDQASKKFQLAIRMCREQCTGKDAQSVLFRIEQDAFLELQKIYARSKDWLNANDEFEQREAWSRKLLKENPSEAKYIDLLSDTLLRHAQLHATHGRAAECVLSCNEAISLLQSALEQFPKLANAKGNLARAHEARALANKTLEQYDAEIVDWDRAIELTPVSLQPRLRAMRALSQLRTGKHSDAIAEVDALAKRSDLKVNDWYNCACIYAIASDKLVDIQKELSDRAMESLSESISAGYINDTHMLTDSDLENIRGRSDFKQLLLSLQQSNEAKRLQKLDRNDDALGKYQESIESCSKLAKELPTLKSFCKLLGDGHKGKGELLVRMGRRDDAKVENERRLRLFKELADQTPSQFEFRVGLIDAVYDYANFVGETGNHEETLKWLDRALQTATIDYKQFPLEQRVLQERLKTRLINCFLRRASVFGKLNNHQAAVKDYDEAIKVDPKYSMFYFNRGVANSKLKDDTAAIRDYDEAIRLDPKNVNAYINRGSIKSKLKDYVAAIKDFGDAIRLDPKNANAYGSRGWSNHNLRDYTAANRDYDEAIRLNPKSTNPKYNKAFLLSTAEDAKIRNPEQALELAEESLNEDPKNAYALNAKSCALAAKGDFEAAIALQSSITDTDWQKDDGIDGGALAKARISVWKSGELWLP